MSGNFKGLLEAWIGSQVTVINPESFKSTALGQGLSFQSYKAKVIEIGDDYMKLSFTAVKKDTQNEVEQIIPIYLIKRISIWGEEKLIHL